MSLSQALATAPEPLLHRAARLGDDEETARLIAAGTPPDERGDFLRDHGAFFTGLTPLMVAAGSLDGATAKTLEVLLRLGATLCARSGAGVTAAWYAAGTGLSREPTPPSRPHDRADRLRFLLEKGLDPRECADNGRSLLVEACRSGIAERIGLLLERGVHPEPSFDAKGSGLVDDMREHLRRAGIPQKMLDLVANRLREEPATRPSSFQIPLFCASASGSAECVRLLLRAGADPAALDDCGSTALFEASSPEVAQALLGAGCPLDVVSKHGKDALEEIIEETRHAPDGRGGLAVARVLLEAGSDIERRDKYGHTRLYQTAFQRVDLAVEFLLRSGADPRAEQGDEGTPLHAVAWQGESCEAVVNAASARIVDLLVAAGIPPDARHAGGRTSLHQAARGDWGHATVVRALLGHGAAPDPGDGDGTTPLMLAAERGEVPCIKLLLDAGADPLTRDREGRTALDRAREHLRSWRKICREPPGVLAELSHEDPAAIEARHTHALAEAREAFALIREAAARKRRRGRR